MNKPAIREELDMITVYCSNPKCKKLFLLLMQPEGLVYCYKCAMEEYK